MISYVLFPFSIIVLCSIIIIIVLYSVSISFLLFSLFSPFEFKFLSTKNPCKTSIHWRSSPHFLAHVSTLVPSPNHCSYQLQYVVLICDKYSTFFCTSALFSLHLPHPHCINFVCIVSTALFISVSHCLALLHCSSCISAHFWLHFLYFAVFHTLCFLCFHHISSRNIGTLRLCLRHFLHICTHITKSLFCVPTLVFIDHTLYLHTTQMY